MRPDAAMTDRLDDRVQALAAALDASTNAVVFTGAGISTESGIPDFRSPGGIWTKYRPIPFDEFIASEEARREYWRRTFARHVDMARAEPNRGHRAVAHLVRNGKVAKVITQNIDGLHQASGVPEDRVIELHGNATYAECLDCAEAFELDRIRDAFLENEVPPICDICGGMVKLATISFGQAMPVGEMARAEHATLAADLFLVMGSSLVVYPAAGFPMLAKQNGAHLAIVNREPTELDEIADLVIHGEIGPILGAAVGVN
jgi:NAD-dependent protein deacetylase/lipoamidase